MRGAYNPDQTGLTKANKALPVSLAPTFTKTRENKVTAFVARHQETRPKRSRKEPRETGYCCTALTGTSPRRCGMCTIRSRYSFERERWGGKSLRSAQTCDLSGRRGAGRTGTCNCFSGATKGPTGTVTCARSSPNCCQMCDGSVTSGPTRLDPLGTWGHLGWRRRAEGS